MKKLMVVVALLVTTLVLVPAARADHEPRHVTGYIPVAQGTDKATTLHYQGIDDAQPIAGTVSTDVELTLTLVGPNGTTTITVTPGIDNEVLIP